MLWLPSERGSLLRKFAVRQSILVCDIMPAYRESPSNPCVSLCDTVYMTVVYFLLFHIHAYFLEYVWHMLRWSTETSALFSSYYIQLTINILIKHYRTLQYAAT
jgi:hypothetical protein